MDDKKASHGVSKLGAFWIDYGRCIALAVRGIGRDNISIMASGMVYSTLIAVVPCLTFLIAFLSAFGVLQPFMNLIAMIFEDTFGMIFEDTFGENTGKELVSYIQQFSTNAMSLGVIGLVSFIFTGILLVNKIYTAINQIFRTRATSGTVKRFTAILTFLIMGAFMIVSVFALQSMVTNTIAIEDKDDLLDYRSNYWNYLASSGNRNLQGSHPVHGQLFRHLRFNGIDIYRASLSLHLLVPYPLLSGACLCTSVQTGQDRHNGKCTGACKTDI